MNTSVKLPNTGLSDRVPRYGGRTFTRNRLNNWNQPINPQKGDVGQLNIGITSHNKTGWHFVMKQGSPGIVRF